MICFAMRDAEFWEKTERGTAVCGLCPHRCELAEGGTGRCRARGVRDGVMVPLEYGNLSSVHIDPIEKKPLYHFHPGSRIFSVGGWGCNLACRFCQNWSISQTVRSAAGFSAGDVVEEAVTEGCTSIAYTYNEPLVGFEFVKDCATAAREAGLANVAVTNGHIERGPAEDLLPLLDAVNVDVKSMDSHFYEDVCKGQLQPVLEFVELAAEVGCHVEVTNLVIPGMNDDPDNFRALRDWLAGGPGSSTALHLSAYHPAHQLDVPPTPADTLLDAREICLEKLYYVFIGNVLTDTGQDTVCPGCGQVLISRRGYAVTVTGIQAGRCTSCGRETDVTGV